MPEQQITPLRQRISSIEALRRMTAFHPFRTYIRRPWHRRRAEHPETAKSKTRALRWPFTALRFRRHPPLWRIKPTPVRHPG
jgi:hypothetical protein